MNIYFIGDTRLADLPITEIIVEHRTYAGDGIYNDQHDNEYIVDTGVIGLAKAEVSIKNHIEIYTNLYGVNCGIFIKLNENETYLEYDDGIFNFGDKIYIQTNTHKIQDILESTFRKGE